MLTLNFIHTIFNLSSMVTRDQNQHLSKCLDSNIFFFHSYKNERTIYGSCTNFQMISITYVHPLYILPAIKLRGEEARVCCVAFNYLLSEIRIYLIPITWTNTINCRRWRWGVPVVPFTCVVHL